MRAGGVRARPGERCRPANNQADARRWVVVWPSSSFCSLSSLCFPCRPAFVPVGLCLEAVDIDPFGGGPGRAEAVRRVGVVR